MAERAIAWGQSLPAPAKLNLFLHVLGRRADGYHRLETLFRLIELQDSLRFEPRTDGELRLATAVPGLPAGDDLCVRAARALLAAAPTGTVLPGVDIHLDKRIPVGGGLGGGSSDAATTLVALNALWGLRLPRERLLEIAATLGADVPFFVFGRNAYAEGVGEQLSAARLGTAWYVVLHPGVAVPTGAIFSAPELTRDTKSVKIPSFSAGSGGWSRTCPAGAWPAWVPEFGANDLEPVVCSRYPAVAGQLKVLRQAAQVLGRGGATVRMSGSGACTFAELPDEGAARAVLAAVPQGKAEQGWVVRGLEQHPLYGL